MFKIGDKINFGTLVGEIVDINAKNWIGFTPKSEVYYDIILKGVPEEKIKPTKNGTD